MIFRSAQAATARMGSNFTTIVRPMVHKVDDLSSCREYSRLDISGWEASMAASDWNEGTDVYRLISISSCSLDDDVAKWVFISVIKSYQE